MKVLITGTNGFIGSNLRSHLSRLPNIEIVSFTKDSDPESLYDVLEDADFIFHCAGVNRPLNADEFILGNVKLTSLICDAVKNRSSETPILFASSIHVGQSTDYALSKHEAEKVIQRFSEETGNPVFVFRLPNVFGKWSRPNYNSVVATFCHNMANDLPVQINNASTSLRLVYIDDVIQKFIEVMNSNKTGINFPEISPEYNITLGELAEKIRHFKHSRDTLVTERVGGGFDRALYSTYLTYLPTSKFSYPLIEHSDERGVFVEFLKTKDSGQFSFFTAKPGVTRGGHYHHTKTEKFLVLKGCALFKFKNLSTNEYYDLEVDSKTPTVVETIPGWAHDITNVSNEEMIVMLWANEIYDLLLPDTYGYLLKNKI